MKKHQVIFYPVGNGDCSQIILDNNKRIILDYRHRTGDDIQFNLEEHLKKEFKEANRDYVDILAFTHNDEDHIANSTEFFELDHAEKYQGNGRIRINELWVPAAMILDPATNEEMKSEYVTLRQEARHRLREGYGIKVFSKPELLKKWLNEEGLIGKRDDFIIDAGQIVPGLSLKDDDIEFFCHSPFVKHVDDGNDIQSNEAALIFQIRFDADGTQTNLMAIGDTTWDVLDDIIDTTTKHGNEGRLDWDLLNIPHHCSYKALSDEKSNNITSPKDGAKELLNHCQEGSYMISSSHPIKDTADARKEKQPPHIQAKKAYEKALEDNDGRRLYVTMEEPNENAPKPLVFEITNNGSRQISSGSIGGGLGATIITSNKPPRAGHL